MRRTKLTVDEALNPVILLLGFKGDQVHAPLPAVVPCVEPAPLGVGGAEITVQPAEVVIVTSERVNSGFVYT